MGEYVFSQSHYIEKVSKKFSHLKVKEASTQFDPRIKLFKNGCRAHAQLEYTSVVGSLMYATQCTRSNIVFAISKLSRFTKNPSVRTLESH